LRTTQSKDLQLPLLLSLPLRLLPLLLFFTIVILRRRAENLLSRLFLPLPALLFVIPQRSGGICFCTLFSP
jgi:hypothetical protein